MRSRASRSCYISIVTIALSLFFISPALARSFRVGLLPEKARAMKCSVCHVDPKGGGPRNAFGKDYEKLAIPAGEKITDALASADSDGDGVSNKAELEAGTNPGDKASKP